MSDTHQSEKPKPVDTEATLDETVDMSTTATVHDTVMLAAEETPGDVIGRYKLLEKIGEGGFGMVYVAEQTEPVRRQVALKITKLGMDTRQVVARFEMERQALAMMEHPNIAKVFDAGATDTGRPYFVMELVRGTKITEYCDQNKLSTRKRLDLFILVCRAIEHAHQKGIIHRDIKPSNILITLHDGEPVPKVIDFGIAKATQAGMENAFVTRAEQFIGTPAYMSPEQAEAGATDIDTRSDIYSLGVLLYELLTGETPLESKNLLERGFDEMRRLILEWEPQRPSTRLHKQQSKDQTTTATRHGTDVPKLIRMVRGDLDWVAMKCLEKDRNRRYATAAELTADIERFLANEPVVARPPSNLYRFKKLVQRNRLAFAAGSAILVSLIAGLCVTLWFVVKEKEERDIAERDRRNSDSDLKIAKDALAQAEAARKQSDIDRKHTEEALRQSEEDRATAVTAEKKAEASQQEAETARQQAEAALKQARDDRNKATLAERQAQDSQSKAVTAQEEAKAAETQALSEAARRDQAIKTAVSETALRRQAEAARAQAEASLEQAKIARQQSDALAAAALAEAGQARETVSNFIARLDTQPPADALKAANVFFVPGDEKQPWAARFLRQRGEWLARTGDWKKAIADFSTALELKPANPEPYDALTVLFLQAGDTNAYSSNCARFLTQFGGTNDLAIIRFVAKDCLLAPLAGVDIGAATAVARRDTATNNQLTLALAEYRQGHYAEAADWAGKALAGGAPNANYEAQACATLAMAQQQLKQTENARATLARGTQIMETRLPKLENGDIGLEWNQWIMTRALMREAGALINAPPLVK